MAQLTLKDIGKIYVSDGNVAVGIRGVNLSFDRGEFVAITGKSGSGKSTLLNVISGMDSYEEGELYIEGQPTSHYLESDLEEYREKYISFIFQDYNIIESFTVLQNVELALMHIEDKNERRKRAVELIDRVGLSSHMKHKGSKLSGGQKQRTVIARSLAKDSPIILADEPTGNLDSATSKEILKLLYEVSHDKLVIVVTHNFEQVEEYATRHIRIFDGAVEFDHTLKAPEIISGYSEDTRKDKENSKKTKKSWVKNGLALGRAIFTAKPKLSLFLCLLMLIGTMGIFFVAALSGEATAELNPSYMFNHIDGRVVLTKQSGEIITDDELAKLVTDLGAESFLHYDQLLDESMNQQVIIPSADSEYADAFLMAHSTYGKSYGDKVIGRYPESKDEVLLYLPISYQPELGKESLKVSNIIIGRTVYKLVGVKYYYDNNIDPECLFTDEGFRFATAVHFLVGYSDMRFKISLKSEGDEPEKIFNAHTMIPSFDMPADKIYVGLTSYNMSVNNNIASGTEYTAEASFVANYYRYNYINGITRYYSFERDFKNDEITNVLPEFNGYELLLPSEAIIISDEIICEIAENVLKNSYVQASIFFKDDNAAKKAVSALQDRGYIAVVSDTTYEVGSDDAMSSLLGCVLMIAAFIAAVVFLAFFITLCSSRALEAFREDIAIMRSMGIQVKVIRIGMYVRMLLSLIPAFIIVAITAILIFTSPKFNEYFTYLYAWQYAVIIIGMVALTLKTTHNQIRRLFGKSVKKSLRGGDV
ncbi:MAG: ATP-binding cassette domain-containing protein [Clostridia bacterium]|nr:ATP-binding cassette domain-containing protein [Clostridia bacterium]